MPPPRTRLTDLAELAQVSTATVSRVLNGKPGVAPQTRREVLAAFDQLGYDRPDRIGKTTGLVGLVVPELTNPVFPAFAQHLETFLAAAGYTSILCTSGPGGTTEAEYLDILGEHQVAGIVSVSGITANTEMSMEPYRRLMARGVSFAFINGFQADVDAAFFSTDDAAAIRASLEHLWSLGHTRIGLAIGSPRYVPAIRKIDAFLAGQASRGIDAADSISGTVYTVEGGQLAATSLIRSGHTAIICGSDLMALGAVRAAAQLGKQVPADVSVVGYDDSPIMAFTSPALTTVRQPVQALCEAAVAALVAEIEHDHVHHGEMLFHPDLVVRSSTGSAAS